MTEIEVYDILILGGGKAGKTLAMDQAKAGKRVAIIEAGMIGGSCINIACIPTKALVRSAEVAETVRHAGFFGMNGGDAPVDMHRVTDPGKRIVQRRWARAMCQAEGLLRVYRVGKRPFAFRPSSLIRENRTAGKQTC